MVDLHKPPLKITVSVQTPSGTNYKLHTVDIVPVLQTKRLVLRGHRKSDFDACAAMWADEKVVAHISALPSTSEQSWSRLLRYAGHWHHLGFGYWAVDSRADGGFLGEVGFADYHRNTEPSLAGKPEAGWVFKASAHGQGFASEAATAMHEWADANLDCSHTCAMFVPSHAASIRVAEKVGYSNGVMGRYGEHEALFMERVRKTTS
ncbi:MAG: GNAT family N-acetyltransferase [Pseudomonadota bacterium]